MPVPVRGLYFRPLSESSTDTTQVTDASELQEGQAYHLIINLEAGEGFINSEGRETDTDLNEELRESKFRELIYTGYQNSKHAKPKTLLCPFHGCTKTFRETGNLKTHIRTHVSHLTHRPESVHSPAASKVVTGDSSPRAI